MPVARPRRSTTPPASLRARPSADDQRRSLLLHEHAGLETLAQTERFLSNVGVALRYGPHKTLPLASMYAAVWRSVPERESEASMQRRATQLTNQLIARGDAMETNAIAGRVGLVHASTIPALIALVRRGRAAADVELSATARRVLGFLARTPRPTAGQVRAYLGVPPQQWPNAADDALGELQRATLIDRGDTDVPDKGAAYLTKDGIPYRLVDDVHAAHVKAAGKLTVDAAAAQLVERYLDGARFATTKQLAKIFEACMSPAELAAALDRLARKVELVTDHRAHLAIRRA